MSCQMNGVRNGTTPNEEKNVILSDKNSSLVLVTESDNFSKSFDLASSLAAK